MVRLPGPRVGILGGGLGEWKFDNASIGGTDRRFKHAMQQVMRMYAGRKQRSIYIHVDREDGDDDRIRIKLFFIHRRYMYSR